MAAGLQFMSGGLTKAKRPMTCMRWANARRTLCGIWFVLGFAVAISLGAEERDAAGYEFFEKNIRPLLVTHCYECHAGNEAKGGLLLDSRAGVLRGGDSGTAVVAGHPAASRLIEAVRYANPDFQMPPKNRLSAAEVALLEAWVERGAPDPRNDPLANAIAPTGMSIADGREFWSFRPVSRPSVPTIRRADWVQTPIDAFVLAALESKGLEPAPPADRRTLLRRLSDNLTGLPPTPDEQQAYLSEDAATALPRVVNRLLDSPDYGVRWGRHWLDVARYADSNGLDENLAYGQAWRYRDYVVQAFANDKPFHRFLVEQIAGDLLPDATAETKTATGFLMLGAKVLAEPDFQKLEMDTIDEQIDTLGKAFLGMTLGCVRCHDHKFDPIKQTDYYALAAIFKSTKNWDGTNYGAIKHWYEHRLSSDEELAQMKAIDTAIEAKKNAANAYKATATAKLRAAVRAQAAQYLAACAEFSPGMSLVEVTTIATARGLHPYVLHRCRSYLAVKTDELLLEAWHRQAGNAAAIEQTYKSLFADAEALAQEPAEPEAVVSAVRDPLRELARRALYDSEGFLAIPAKPEHAFDSATLAEYHRLAEEARVAESTAPDVPAAMGVADGTIGDSLPIHVRGSHRNLGAPTQRAFPVVMQSHNDRPALPADRSGRLELAEWLANPKHPLTARVYVNRVWRWHFGRGLVASPDNFGRLGEPPSHPELLDWLTNWFIDSGWSTKALHRLILQSSTYQMASTHPDEANAALLDPDNRLIWRFRLQRLDAESIRDALLAVSGRLDRTLGGKSVPLRNRQFVFDHTSIDHTKYDSLRRAIYLPIIRNNVYPLFEQFDFPDPTMPTGSRNTTVVAPQALLFLNSDLVMDSASAWAEQLLSRHDQDAVRVEHAYLAAFGRPPAETEVSRALAFLQGATTSHREAWIDLCHTLLASNEFIYLR